jgi:secreted trypsin-like serine protease
VALSRGSTENQTSGQHSDVLREVKVFVKPFSTCSEDEHIGQVITRRSLCVGGDGAGPCSGDSGGGIFTSVGNTWLLRGITSVNLRDSHSDCHTNKPAVYTNMEKFTSWVERFLNENVKFKNEVTKFDKNVCDEVSNRATNIFVDGKISYSNKWPWLVALFTTSKHTFFGGGSLISKRFVLTAAHGLQDKKEERPIDPKDVIVYLGRWNLTDPTEASVTEQPEEFFIHPDWNPFDTRWDADIAVIKLTNDVALSENIRPVCLWTSKIKAKAKQNKRKYNVGVVVGW